MNRHATPPYSCRCHTICSQGSFGEYAVRRLIDWLILSITNAGIKYWNRKRLLTEENKVFALWQEISAEVRCVLNLLSNLVFN